MSDDPYQWKPWLPEFTKPLDQRIKQEVPCMDTVSKSKPPEGTPTPSTDSRPSYMALSDFCKQVIPPSAAAIGLYPETLELQIAWWLAQRGSPR
jgi:hypothetical protein